MINPWQDTLDEYRPVNAPDFDLSAPLPEYIGRYRVERLLGRGGFGLVYLAHDEKLQRLVAIKVPHARCVAEDCDYELYLIEARAVACLDHPHIVPVHDLGSTQQFPCFIVSKYIDGTNLLTRLKHSRLATHELVQLAATVAEALHHAHMQGVVHRDIKPGNILLDRNGKPFVGDFGLALREQDVGKGPRYAGTPAYMSPEQARGEGHRVDGRSDIFSLGVVLYEMLTGRHPFRKDSREELLDQVMNLEPRPPRQIDDTISKELERICLTALSKRTSERYTTARDLADDLRQFQAEMAVAPKPAVQEMPVVVVPSATPISSVLSSSTSVKPISDGQLLRIVPRGLRSFDEHDADFFLELLPGPRDRHGLPTSIRFWKNCIEETDADKTFSVGLIYGPSGCGKSSMMKAGLLPRLSADIVVIYIEATGHETESRLLKKLRHRCPSLPTHLGLKETLAMLRRDQSIQAGRKVLVVIDQFEQWLHARTESESKELIQSLRQCDGGRVQCILTVRDDFWLAVSRFLRELDVRIVEGQNSALTDLFDLDHARKVLMAFGRAYGKLPEKSSEMAPEQTGFLKQVVAGLAQDGRVISVRLAVFSEMMKNKPWTVASLKEVGGTEGIGVTYLEEIFSAKTAPPEHRYHQVAARAVLKSLLPDIGMDIKGHMRSYRELLGVSGYADDSEDFEDLIRICDREVRLITPTDPEGNEAAGGRSTLAFSSLKGISDDRAQTTLNSHTVAPRSHVLSSDVQYYQLTHDYLVPSLRDWLTRKQQETTRGRAELRLEDRANLWNSRPENKQLPSLLQWFQFRWLTAKSHWTAPQRRMMATAAWYHAVRGIAVAGALILIGWAGYEAHGTLKAQALRERLLDANTLEVPAIVRDMSAYRRWLDPLLQKALTEARTNPRKQLHLSMALLPVDTRQVTFLTDRLLDAEASEVPVILDTLSPYKDALREKLWEVVESPDAAIAHQRLPAAAGLARFDGAEMTDEKGRWQRMSRIITDDLLAAVQKHPNDFATLVNLLHPVRTQLAPRLAETYRSKLRSETDRLFATNILADYAADAPRFLADLLLDADANQFRLLFPKLETHRATGLNVFHDEVNKRREMIDEVRAREDLARRQANAAVGIWRLDGPVAVRHLLEHSHDPTVRSYLIRRLGPFGATTSREIKRLVAAEQNVTIRRALILSLSDIMDSPAQEQSALVEWLLTIFQEEPDAGLHAAASYVLETLGEHVQIEIAREKLRLTEAQIQERHSSGLEGSPDWHVNGHGQTMVVIRGPVRFVMGAPANETGRESQEVEHAVQINRSFAISARSVTVDEFRRLPPDRTGFVVVGNQPDHPVTQVSWHDAAAYCNRLSRQEGIPPDQWCYETDAGERVTQVRANYLGLKGYRLPTEAEMEFATRAGAWTNRYFGESDELLSGYGWYVPNSSGTIQPGGRLRPNDLGLFDTHGNVWNWCQDKMRKYPETIAGESVEDRESDLDVDSWTRVLRGGCYTDHASGLRSAHRWTVAPMQSSNIIGFRIARTISTK